MCWSGAMSAFVDDSNGESGTTYRIRLMFFISPNFSSTLSSIEFQVSRYRVCMTAVRAEEFSKTNQIYIDVRGIENLEHAERLSRELKAAVLWAAVESGIGVDIGFDEFAGGLTIDGIKAAAKALNVEETAFRLSIHGVDIFEDRGSVITTTSGTISVQTGVGPQQFKEAFERRFSSESLAIPHNCFLALRFRAEASMSKDKLAMFLLSLASLEALTDRGKWSAKQKEAINTAIAGFKEDETLSDIEREDLITTFDGVHRKSIRRSLRALLIKLGKTEYLEDIDLIYQARSRLVHGQREYDIDFDVIRKTMKLSSEIILKYLESCHSSEM